MLGYNSAMSSMPRSSRREFLQGKAVVDALAEATLASAVPEPLAEPATGSYLLELSRRAMACQFQIFLNAGQYQRDTETAVAALDLIDRLEEQLSVYREQSEISQLNRLAAHEWVTVEPRLFTLLEKAVELHAHTTGAYDITAGPLSSAWGFTRRLGAIPQSDELLLALESVGSQYLELNRADRRVRFSKAGVAINLGSIGKGYALDRAAELLTAAGIDDFLLHGGHSSVLGRGAHGSRARDQGWSVGVRHPLRPERRLGELCLKDRGLATSGSGTQFFLYEGRRYGHILDPRTGWPAEGVLSVSVLAPTAAEADALSTAFYVMGNEAAREYCRQHPDISALMLCPGARAGSLETHFLGIDERDWTPAEESMSRE
jgi:thiamine biosynthesis lipoprotein